MKLYKDKYILAVFNYENDDELIGVYDNSREIADTFDIPYDTMHTIVSRAWNGKGNYFKYKNRKYKIYFIDVTEKEEN